MTTAATSTSPQRRLPAALDREYLTDPPAACRCAWSNFADYGGWCRTTTQRVCPLHGADAAPYSTS